MAKKNPVNITEASESHEADILSRETRYLISMAVRLVCFVLAIVFSGWLRWVFAAGAIVLPWIAVLIANNAAAPKAESSANFTDATGFDELGDGSASDSAGAPGSGRAGPNTHATGGAGAPDAAGADDDVIFGEIVRPLERGNDDHD